MIATLEVIASLSMNVIGFLGQIKTFLCCYRDKQVMHRMCNISFKNLDKAFNS